MYSSLDYAGLPDLSLIQQEVDALEELSRQLFLETADLHATKVWNKITAQMGVGGQSRLNENMLPEIESCLAGKCWNVVEWESVVAFQNLKESL